MVSYMCEKDVKKYLKKSKDNIIIAFGHNVNFVNRSEIKDVLSNPMYCYTGEDNKRYYQVIGRPLLSEENINKILDNNYSIFNISVLTNVIKVFSDAETSNIHTRSTYDVEHYTKNDYSKI